MLRGANWKWNRGVSCLGLRSSLRAQGNHLGVLATLMCKVVRPVRRPRLGRTLKLHLEECYVLLVRPVEWFPGWEWPPVRGPGSWEAQTMAEEGAVVWGRQRRPCLCVWLVKGSQIWVG